VARNIAEWLERLGMSRYVELFAEQEIGLDLLPDLSDADLKASRRLLAELAARWFGRLKPG